MTDFKPITTQEEFDTAISERLKRDRETREKKYEGYISPADVEKMKSDYDKQITELNASIESSAKKYANYDKDIAERDAKIKGYETASLKTRVALETGLPYELASRLTGETEEDIRKDAEVIKQLMGSNQKQVAPAASTETKADGDPKTAALRKTIEKMKGE